MSEYEWTPDEEKGFLVRRAQRDARRAIQKARRPATQKEMDDYIRWRKSTEEKRRLELDRPNRERLAHEDDMFDNPWPRATVVPRRPDSP